MISKSLIKDETQPIIIGFAGRAGSGKTSVAEHIVPKGSINVIKHDIKWDHLFFALPLYELASARRHIAGINEDSRTLYAIHDVLYDLFGGSPIANVPHYDALIDMVRFIYNMPIEKEGIKPRTFLQVAGDVCRAFDVNCFTNWAIRKSKSIYRSHIKEFESNLDNDFDVDPNPMAIIISDVRFLNEAESILSEPNGILVCFDASDEVLNDRILKRDGKPMSKEQLSHKSESYIEDIKKIATFVINSDNMNIEQQTDATLEALGIINQKKEQNA